MGSTQKQQFNLKNGEQDNCKIMNLPWLLTILFAFLLGFNNLKRVVAAVGQNLVCKRRYDGSHVRHENNELNEKMVSECTA